MKYLFRRFLIAIVAALLMWISSILSYFGVVFYNIMQPVALSFVMSSILVPVLIFYFFDPEISRLKSNQVRQDLYLSQIPKFKFFWGTIKFPLFLTVLILIPHFVSFMVFVGINHDIFLGDLGELEVITSLILFSGILVAIYFVTVQLKYLVRKPRFLPNKSSVYILLSILAPVILGGVIAGIVFLASFISENDVFLLYNLMFLILQFISPETALFLILVPIFAIPFLFAIWNINVFWNQYLQSPEEG